MVNIRKNPRIIHSCCFFINRIGLPIFFSLCMATVTFFVFSRRQVLAIAAIVPSLSDNWKGLIQQLPSMYFIVLVIVWYILYILALHKLVGQKDILPANHYYLVPSWMIKAGSIISGLHGGSAASIPIWQYFEYLYYNSSIGWSSLKLAVPDVLPASSEGKVRSTFHRMIDPTGKSTTLSIIVEDTYPVDLNFLPDEVGQNNYVVVQNASLNHVRGLRGYNQKLVSETVAQIKKAESNGVDTLYLLFNTNPLHVTKIFNESFNDAGRSQINHLYVFEAQPDGPFHFVKAHQIY
ncbi:hypothetical protein OQZ59_08280 [Lacticaseibacillus nasuensis]|nr:hypothetical protein [Lacticaseibacillus nasuensis]